MRRQLWIPFLVATIVAVALAAVVGAAGWNDTVALALGAVVGSAIVSVSIPYVFRVRHLRAAFARNGRNGHAEVNEAAADVRFTHDLLEVAGQHTRASSADVDVTVATSA
jgi:hypothetical protein